MQRGSSQPDTENFHTFVAPPRMQMLPNPDYVTSSDLTELERQLKVFS